mmetsp:Transcript_8012/g.33489  ORF Transcript_8012/g.33489 Transcript_8012/m.33489 type:complete len:406 (-) Transcript_8012:316-1533(-)
MRAPRVARAVRRGGRAGAGHGPQPHVREREVRAVRSLLHAARVRVLVERGRGRRAAVPARAALALGGGGEAVEEGRAVRQPRAHLVAHRALDAQQLVPAPSAPAAPSSGVRAAGAERRAPSRAVPPERRRRRPRAVVVARLKREPRPTDTARRRVCVHPSPRAVPVHLPRVARIHAKHAVVHVPVHQTRVVPRVAAGERAVHGLSTRAVAVAVAVFVGVGAGSAFFCCRSSDFLVIILPRGDVRVDVRRRARFFFRLHRQPGPDVRLERLADATRAVVVFSGFVFVRALRGGGHRGVGVARGAGGRRGGGGASTPRGGVRAVRRRRRLRRRGTRRGGGFVRLGETSRRANASHVTSRPHRVASRVRARRARVFGAGGAPTRGGGPGALRVAARRRACVRAARVLP